MKGRVLLIDFDSRDRIRELLFEGLRLRLHDEKYQVTEFRWKKPSSYDEGESEEFELNVNKAVDAAKKVDVIFVHFGSIARAGAAEILGRLKATGAKVIVESVSPVLFEAADYIFFMDLSELERNIKKFCKEKNRS